jgi:hypothetical protein
MLRHAASSLDCCTVTVSVSVLCPSGDEVVLDYLCGGVEGSLVHGERRRAALAERWGFKCRWVLGGRG